MLQILDKDKKLMYYKPSYHGTYRSSVITKNLRLKNPKKKITITVNTLQNSYDGTLSLKAAKYRDLLQFSQFLEKPQAKDF